MNARNVSVATAATGITALILSGITYASAATAASDSAQQAVAAPVAAAPLGGDTGEKKDEAKDKSYDKEEDKSYDKEEDKSYDKEEDKEYDKEYDKKDHGKIYINERSYEPDKDGCVSVVSGAGASSFNIRNETKKTIEFFTGVVCDNGAPVATVGPRSSSTNVIATGATIEVPPPGPNPRVVVGSFRVIDHGYDHHKSDKY